MFHGPDFRNRSPEEIITQDVLFGSDEYTYRSLAWLDLLNGNTMYVLCTMQLVTFDRQLNNCSLRIFS